MGGRRGNKVQSKSKDIVNKVNLKEDEEIMVEDSEFVAAEAIEGLENNEIKKILLEMFKSMKDQSECIMGLKFELVTLRDKYKSLQLQDEKTASINVTLKKQSQCINKLRDEIKNLKQEKNILHQKNLKLQASIDSLEVQNSSVNEKLDDIESNVDEIEQNKLNNSLRIIGVEEVVDDEQYIMNIAERIGIKVEKASIADTYRLGKKNTEKKRDLIVTFKDVKLRELMYKRRKELIPEGIYLNEHLTPTRSELFYHARMLRKKDVILSTWTQKGNILVHLTKDTEPIHIRTLKNLKELEEILREEMKEQGVDSIHECKLEF